MCGIVGFISTRANGFLLDDLKFFNKALVINGLNRGMDSTGIYSVFKDGGITSFKNNTNAMLFQEDLDYDQMMKYTLQEGRILVGHGRAATRGEVTRENAHPFHHEHICLVHNGTLWNHTDFAKTEVDSEALAIALAESTPQEVLPKVRGAFALVWFNQQEDALYFIRNSERPLSIAELPGGLFLSSESSLTEYLAERQKERIISIKEVPTEMLFKYDRQSGKLTWESLPLHKATVTTYTAPAAVARTTYMGANHGGRTTPVGTTTTTTSASNTGRAVVLGGGGNLYANALEEVRKDYKVGDTILIKVDRISSDLGLSSHRIVGRSIEPKRRNVDIAGTFYTQDNSPPDKAWYGQNIIADVSHISSSNCGVTVSVRNIRQSPMVQTHNGQISGHEAAHVCNEELCKKCSDLILPEFLPVTTVSRTGVNTDASYRVICHNCINEAITVKEVKDGFKSKVAAIQERVKQRQTSLGNTDHTPRATGTSGKA